MTNKATIITVIIITVIIWLILQNKQEPLQKINTVTLKTNDQKLIPVKKTNTKPTTIKTIFDDTSHVVKPEKHTNKLNELTYMQLYEKLLDAKDCSDIHQRRNNSKYRNINDDNEIEKTFMEVFNDRIVEYSRGKQKQPTASQFEYYQNHIYYCLNFQKEIKDYSNVDEHEKNSNDFIIDQIKVSMKDIKPVSAEGKQLKKTFLEIKQYQNAISSLSRLSNGKSNLSEENSIEIKREIMNLKNQLSDVRFFGNDAKLTPEYISLKQELDKNQAFLDSNQIIDKQKLSRHYEMYNNSYTKLQLQLNTKFPNVFRETFNALNFNSNSNSENQLPSLNKSDALKKLGIEIPYISQLIFAQSSIKDKNYFNLLLQSSLDLYECYLGEECNFPNSRRLAHLCYIPPKGYESVNRGLFYESCDMSLEDFYLLHYFSENQIEDMNEVFNYLVSNYAN